MQLFGSVGILWRMVGGGETGLAGGMHLFVTAGAYTALGHCRLVDTVCFHFEIWQALLPAWKTRA